MGLVLWLGHLTILRSRTQRNVALWAAVTTWSLSALARWAILVGGLQFFDLPDEIPALTRALTSLVVVNLGYAFAAYGLEAYAPSPRSARWLCHNFSPVKKNSQPTGRRWIL